MKFNYAVGEEIYIDEKKYVVESRIRKETKYKKKTTYILKDEIGDVHTFDEKFIDKNKQ